MASDTSVEREEALLDSHGDPCTAEVYWDDSDPHDTGFAYRIRWDDGREESGPCHGPNPWQDVHAFLGPDAAYSDGSPLCDD